MRNGSLDKKSMDYVPTWDEAGVPKELQRKIETEWEDEIKMARYQKQLDFYIENYQRKHREKLREKILEKKSVETVKMTAHWFKTLNEEEKRELVDRSRDLADKVFDELTLTVKASWELNYLEVLRLRVKQGRMNLSIPTDSKLKRFPNYDFGTNKLYGSNYSFYRMWAHCFPSLRKNAVVNMI